MDTPRLGLPEIQAAQAQKHVTHNAALALLDALVQASVVNRTTTGAPVSPTAGDAYIVAAPATGAWIGQDNALALWGGSAWSFIPARLGMIAFDQAEGVLVAFTGVWSPLPSSPDFSGKTVLADRVGIGGATPDSENKLAVYATNVLLNSPGSIDATFNKASAADDASFSFKQGFIARAILGLLGDNNFAIKVGSLFKTALSIGSESGIVSLPQNPCFEAFLASGGTVQVGGAIPFSATRFNVGGHFDTSTGFFVAPADGVYHFGGTIAVDTADILSGAFISSYVNNGVYRDVLEGVGSHVAHYQSDYGFLATLAAGDTVSIRVRGSATSLRFEAGPQFRSSFYGFKVS